MAENKNTDEEFDGFETLDDGFEDSGVDAPMDDMVDDAEFQDLSDSLDSDVFEEDAQPAAPAKKKTNWFNIIVAVVAIAGAGGLILNKLGPQLLGGGAPGPMNNGAQMAAGPDATPAQSEAAAQAALAPQPGVPEGGMLENPDAFAQLAGSVPSPAVQQAEEAAIPDPFAGLSKSDANAVPMPAPIMAEPAPAVPATEVAADDVAEAAQQAATEIPAPALEAVPAVPAVPAAPVVAEAIPAPVVATVDTSAIQGQVDTLAGRMDSIESKLDTAIANLQQGQQQVAAPADDARFDAIQKVLERMETRLDDLSNRAPVRSARADIVDDAPAAAPAKKKTLPKKAAAPKKQDATWDAPYTPGKTAETAAPVSAPVGNAGNWELRGAQPGTAIIGQPGGGDVRQVSVGDTVSGIGQVTGIAQMKGRWVVQGTQGRLSQ